MYAVLLIIGAYLLGSIPFGLLIGLARGVDIREHGSQNIGATNTGRVLGRKWGYLCLALDILKGFLPTLAASFILVTEPVQMGMLVQWILVGVAAVLGHTLPIYLKFRGGKGVATTVGVALGIFPYYTVAMAAALVLYAIVRFGTGVVSAGSLTIAVAFPVAFFVYLRLDPDMSLREFWPLATVSVLLGLLIIMRHRGNIARLLRGDEMHLTPPKSAPPKTEPEAPARAPQSEPEAPARATDPNPKRKRGPTPTPPTPTSTPPPTNSA